jgi:lipoate synthase
MVLNQQTKNITEKTLKKNKHKAQVKRAQRKHTKSVARKGKGAQYGASVSAFNKIKQLIPQAETEGRIVVGVDSKHNDIENNDNTIIIA